MGDRHSTGVKILISALGLGVLGDLLFHGASFGLNAVVWTMSLIAFGTFLLWKTESAVSKKIAWLIPFTLLFGLGFAIHDSPGMWLVNSIGLTVCLALIIGHARNSDVTKLSIVEGTLGLLVTWLTLIVDFFILFIEDIQWKALGRRTDLSRHAPVLRGLLIAAPLLLVFGLLMGSADAVFKSYFTQMLSFDPTNIITHGGLFVCFAGIAIAMLRHCLLGKPVDYAMDREESLMSGGATEATVVMGSLIALFGLFVAIQFRYFFGGQGLVLSTTGLTYSQYARQGFFQLVAISALALPVMLMMTSFARRGGAQIIRTFTVMAGIMVGLLSVVMVSAVQRMSLYIGEMGLSELRLYTTAFMGWLALVYGIYCLTTLAGRANKFAYASLVAGLAVGAILNFARPGEWITNYNANLATKTRILDTNYLQNLGADAVPALLVALPSLPKERQASTAAWLRSWEQEPADWRGFNYSRARAHDLVQKQKAGLAVMAPDTMMTNSPWGD